MNTFIEIVGFITCTFGLLLGLTVLSIIAMEYLAEKAGIAQKIIIGYFEYRKRKDEEKGEDEE